MLSLLAEINTACLMKGCKTVPVSGIKVFYLGIYGCTYIFLPAVMSAASQILALPGMSGTQLVLTYLSLE